MKKKIKIVFKKAGNPEAINFIEKSIEEIFSDYADVETVFLNDLGPDETFDADVYLLNNTKYLRECIQHARNLERPIQIERSFAKEYADAIRTIPEGSDVLIVNDDLESTQETADMLTIMGFRDFNFIAVDPHDYLNPKYSGVKYAITPAEPDLVPPGVEHIIDIGYRKIAFETIAGIKQGLGLDNEDINLKLFTYSTMVAEPAQDFKDTYVSSYLKSRMLNSYAYDLPLAMILFDHRDQVVYSNQKAEELFPLLRETKVVTVHDVSEELAAIYDNDIFDEQQLMNINDRSCLVEKRLIKLENIPVGRLVIIQDETNIKEMQKTLDQKLIDTGLFAKYDFDDIIGNSDAICQCVKQAKKVAKTDYTILITGESGVGKELFAQSIHNYSGRNNQPFVGVNCAAIPENLLESELFGYEAGAFTGASKGGRIGYFERANHGTIFLDEIGDISPRLQSKLLRVLQERQIMRVGSDRVIDIDVRIIAATNRNLAMEVEKGNFRKDLYYRLNALQIRVPSLRERGDDVIVLFKKFMGNEYVALGNKTLNKLADYEWPGNVRELENCVLYYKTLGQLPAHFSEEKAPEPRAAYENVHYVKSDSEIGTDVREEVLMLLARDNALGHGLGRNVILPHLKEMGYHISDNKIREILGQLADEGLVVIGRGRQGTKITNKGIERISGKSSEALT